MLLPDWFYGFTPPGWWPDKPREPFFHGLNVLPIAANQGVVGSGLGPLVVEVIFSKRQDVLVFGGCCLVTNQNTTVINAPVSGTFSRILVRLRNPAGNVNYSDGRVIGAGNEPGYVPMESLFSPWQFVSLRATYWPIPISIPKGGSLQMDLINMDGAGNKDLRFCFWTAKIYEEREFAA